MSAPARSYSVAWAGRASASFSLHDAAAAHSHTADLRGRSRHRARGRTVCSGIAEVEGERRERRKVESHERKKDGLNWSFKIAKWKTWSCGWNDRLVRNSPTGMCVDDRSRYEGALTGWRCRWRSGAEWRQVCREDFYQGELNPHSFSARGQFGCQVSQDNALFYQQGETRYHYLASQLNWTLTWQPRTPNTARRKPRRPRFGRPSPWRWFTTHSSPPSRRSTAPGARTRPRRGGCGDTRAAGGPARWRVTVAVCACWLRTWTPEKGDGREVWRTPSTGCATSASDVGFLRCVCVPEGEARGEERGGIWCILSTCDRRVRDWEDGERFGSYLQSVLSKLISKRWIEFHN